MRALAELKKGMLLAEVQHRALQPICSQDDLKRRYQEVKIAISQRSLTEDLVLGFKPASYSPPGFG